MRNSGRTVVPIVLDTNELVPTLYNSTNLFEFISCGTLVLIWNNFIYNEAVNIIRRLENHYYPRTGIIADEMIYILDRILIDKYKVPDMPDDYPPITTDRNDDPFIYAALQGNAEYIITSDYRHMVCLGHYRNIPIGTPKMFFEWAQRTYPVETGT